jgi:hypothetical protein
MTACPTWFESHVWYTPMTPLAMAMPIMPATSQVSSLVSPCGMALSSTSRSRNGEAMLRIAATPISASTPPRRAR